MKVLLAEDLVGRNILEGHLTGWGHDVVFANTNEACRRLPEIDPELVILDWVKLGVEATQFREAVRKRREEKYLCILMVAASASKNDIVRGLHAGADDYLLEPYEPVELQAKLIAAQRLIGIHDQLLAARVLVRHQAARDPLNGLWNYRGILEILERELSRSRRENRPLGALLIDLDHFKRINDACDFLGGDEVLREVGRRINAALRPYDFLGRYGEEEFLSVLPGCDGENLVTVGERLRARIAAEPVRYQEKELSVTISVGGVVCLPPMRAEVQALLLAADKALHQAKSTGHNRVEVRTLGSD